jgi:hypothetical protein
MSAWREAFGGSLVEAFLGEDDVWPYPREPVKRSAGSAQVDVPSPVVTCTACRRSVTPQRGELGAECPRCHGLLVTAKLPPAHRAPRPPAKPESRAEVAYRVGEQLIEEFRGRISTVGEIAELWQAVTRVVAESAELDAEHAAKRIRGRYWRESAPWLVEAFVRNGTPGG